MDIFLLSVGYDNNTIAMHAKAGIQWRKQESNGCRVKPGMAAGTAPYHNHHPRGQASGNTIPFLRKQESNGYRVKPGMVMVGYRSRRFVRVLAKASWT